MRDKDDLILEWKDKHARLRDDCDELRHKNRQLERYMEDLPTQDEQHQRNAEISFLFKNVYIGIGVFFLNNWCKYFNILLLVKKK